MVDSFFEPDLLPVLDRSTLEQWANCPQQAALMEHGVAVRESAILNAGIEAHEVFSIAIKEFIGCEGEASAGTLVDVLIGAAHLSRPDVQPDVINAVRYSAWEWAKWLTDPRTGLHWSNILRFDGGYGDQSGQLAVDLKWPAVRLTSEIDLLYSGASPEVLHEVDYKSGHKQFTARDVEESFQFQMHAYLVFENYPAINGHEITIWNTRTNNRSYRVLFHRKDIDQYKTRVINAARIWSQKREKAIADIPAWPEVDKCAICDVAAHCHATRWEVQTPEKLLEKLIATEAAASAIKKQLAAVVKANGSDIVTQAGNAFGKCAPPSTRAKPNALYSTAKNSANED
jgi:hypothetical protein